MFGGEDSSIEGKLKAQINVMDAVAGVKIYGSGIRKMAHLIDNYLLSGSSERSVPTTLKEIQPV